MSGPEFSRSDQQGDSNQDADQSYTNDKPHLNRSTLSVPALLEGDHPAQFRHRGLKVQLFVDAETDEQD